MRRASAWVLLGVAACSGPAPSATCEALCEAAQACGFLPSPLGAGPKPLRNCEERCALSRVGESNDLDGLASLEVEDTELEAWCPSEGTSACVGLAAALRDGVGGLPDVGVATARVRIVASADPLGECGGAGMLATPCAANLDDCEVDDALGLRPPPADGEYTLPTGSPFSAAPPCATMGADTITAKLVAWDGTVVQRSRACVDAVGDPFVFTELVPGPVQASIEVRGRFPDSPEPLSASGDFDIAASALSMPVGGPRGEYCWVFRSELTQITPEGSNDILGVLPPTSLHALARAWRQADEDAKPTQTARLYRCEDSPDRCLNEIDDDGDGLPDCQDPDCLTHCAEGERSIELCENGTDDDDDGLVDCDDPGCALWCEGGESECRNGLDDDDDGMTDCEDPSCARVCDRRTARCPMCMVDDTPAPETCAGRPGPDLCASTPECAWTCGVETAEACANRIDDDADGLIDAADPDCAALHATGLTCVDGLDNERPFECVDCTQAATSCDGAADADDPCCKLIPQQDGT